jgi:hypothetical protein
MYEMSQRHPVWVAENHVNPCNSVGYDVHALLSNVMYILSGKKITAVFPMSRRRWDQNTTQVANRLNRARATYVGLLHVPPWLHVMWRAQLYSFAETLNPPPPLPRFDSYYEDAIGQPR